MPAAVSDFEVVQLEVGSPVVRLTWTHSGVDADRFEVLVQPGGVGAWQSIHLAPVADYGSGPYVFDYVARTGDKFAVVVLDVAGTVST